MSVENLSKLLMIAALISAGAFLYWLGAVSEPTSAEVELAEEGEEPPAFATALAVPLEELQRSERDYVGQRLRINDAVVASRLGSQAFWIALPNQNPYLVKLDSTLIRQEVSVASSDTVSVAGVIHEMSDSILDAWMDAGALTQDVQRIEAEFATTFLEAEGLMFEGRVPREPETDTGGRSASGRLGPAGRGARRRRRKDYGTTGRTREVDRPWRADATPAGRVPPADTT